MSVIRITYASPSPAAPASPATPYPVTHGSQLTVANVGPWALQNVPQGSEVLLDISSEVASNNVVTTYPGYPAPPAWIPGSTYVYDNSPSNHGGVLAEDTVIDGWSVPAGTWICQFCDFNGQSVSIQGDCAGAGSSWPGVMFRGCRMREQWSAPGWYNQNSQRNDGTIWLNFCDAGGVENQWYSSADGGGAQQYACDPMYENEGLGPPDMTIMIRCYLSMAVTFCGVNNSGDASIECYYDNWLAWFNPDGPNSGYYHYNTYSYPGGSQTCNLFLRNHMSFSPQPGSQPWDYPLTVGYQMAADNGAYNGGGTNIDSSTGYQIRDNYIAGGDYCFSFGVDKDNTQADVSDVVVTGNIFTTYWFETFGSTGIAYKVCTFGSQGNVWEDNTYGDDYGTGSWSLADGNSTRPYPAGNGPLAGTEISAPPPG